MDTYSIFREFADSWGLLAMMGFFVGAVLMVLRPSARRMHQDAAEIPLRDDRPIDNQEPYNE
ncbi:cytochrome-c oxidase [Amylibacter marinus]|uniref:Cytochrome-c oxidase n=1 Tax=Amylibacter marinus TaxID=1475483 RepID=A0ABQ5VY54_9RHOB|nr:cbb3-type cytochrome c oxidase subunit 3 [Amylibacter marinus]GLQ36285.1 cytochrome-c oxidase [Amylibacter marinus]